MDILVCLSHYRPQPTISSEGDGDGTAEWYSPREFLSPSPAAAMHARDPESSVGAGGNDEGVADEDSIPKPDGPMSDVESRVHAGTQDTALLLGGEGSAVLPEKVS